MQLWRAVERLQAYRSRCVRRGEGCPVQPDGSSGLSPDHPDLRARFVIHMRRRKIGNTSLEVPALGLGGATLGDSTGAIPESQALSTIECAYFAGIDYFDTSPW